MSEPFAETWNDLARRVHENAVAHGWWEAERNDGEIIALMHSELSEAYEDGLRSGLQMSTHIPEFNAFEEELADLLIRLMDFGYARYYQVGEVVEAIRRDSPLGFLSKAPHGSSADDALSFLILAHWDLSVVLEHIRKGNPRSQALPMFTEIEFRLGYLVERVNDFCLHRSYRLWEAVQAKMIYNASRSYRHGGKKF